MKRIYVSIIILSIFLNFISCGKKPLPEKSRFTIVASFYPVYIIAKNVTKDVPGVTVANLTPPITGCLHDYSVTADDMKKLEKADLMLVNGAGMESFLSTVISRFPNLTTASLSKNIKTIKGSQGENPHIWVNISMYSDMVKNCVDALAEKDPAYEKQYRASGAVYLKKIHALQKDMHLALLPYKGKKIITFHEAFPYFAEEYGLEILSVIEREPGSEPSAKELASTIELVKKSGIKVIFIEPQYPSTSADTIAVETGAKVFVLDPAVTGPDSDDAYIEIMKKNGAVLAQALK